MTPEERKKDKKKKQSQFEKELYSFLYAVVRQTMEQAIDDVLSVLSKK